MCDAVVDPVFLRCRRLESLSRLVVPGEPVQGPARCESDLSRHVCRNLGRGCFHPEWSMVHSAVQGLSPESIPPGYGRVMAGTAGILTRWPKTGGHGLSRVVTIHQKPGL